MKSEQDGVKKIYCKTKEDFKIIQEYFFRRGYEWYSTGKKLWFPDINWKGGCIIEVDSKRYFLYYSLLYWKFDNGIEDSKKFIKRKKLNNDYRKEVIKYIDNLFKRIE